jgi:hypothetical protein
VKLICVEEHVLDRAIGGATQALVRAEAPYFGDWGSRVVDGQNVVDPSRPHVIAPSESARKGLEMGPARLADMDAAGIDMQVLSYGGFPQLLPAAEAIELNRAANDKLAETARAHPTRFAGFATLPWQAPEAAARELERAVKELGLKGALINGRPGDTFLDDARYEPILAAFSELKVPLYVHPGLPLPAVQAPYYGGLERELSARLAMFAWGWHNESGIQVVRMLLAPSTGTPGCRSSAAIGARWCRSSCSGWKTPFLRKPRASGAPSCRPTASMCTSRPAACSHCRTSSSFMR